MITRNRAFEALNYGCAVAAATSTAIFLLSRVGKVQSKKNSSHGRRRLIAGFVGLLCVTYAFEAVITIVWDESFLRSQAHLVHIIALAFLWLITGLRSEYDLYEISGTSFVTGIFEVLLLIFFPFQKAADVVWLLLLICQATRIVPLVALIAISSYVWLESSRVSGAESEPFLRDENGRQVRSRVGYGTGSLIEDADLDDNSTTKSLLDDSDASDEDSDSESESGRRMKKIRAERLKETGSWWNYLKDFSIFLPYLISKNDRKVQFCYAISIACLAADRALNILVPLQLGKVADELLNGGNPYKPLIIWVLLTLLRDQPGLGLIKSLAKIPITQFSYRQITNAAFGHVMGLGMDFHTERDTGEVMKAVEQGTALNKLLEAIVLDMAPTFLDLLISVFFLSWKINIYASLAMVIACITYLALEVRLANWNIGNRRRLTKLERNEAQVMHQAVQGWQTTLYFNMFSYEKRRYSEAVDKQLEADWDWNERDAYIEGILEALVPVTFASLSCLVFLQIRRGQASAGDFVFLIQYWDYLVWPLKFLSEHYRWLMSDLIDAERLLDLLKTKASIVDRDTAKDIGPIQGHVSFEHVYFSYDSQKANLEDIHFSASPGEHIALVGMTGAGKSSITKLLYRLYDVDAGQIKIDGHDIRDITLSSLRAALGIVPQDPLLFNTTIMENMRYARLSATDEEIEDACRAAAIHSKILSFPRGYQTIVGENGVKLSGGEVQRLAIARVFLKNPSILVLDEATSAVDTVTEAEIQSVLLDLRQKRTTFVVAHRLSTIVSADRILVLDDGRIVESGTHAELLSKGGHYKHFWTTQFEGMTNE
ncbi:MAG: hypothetical protein M1820_009467 [Bogoriella megaspora]|nr:MAG: hypothetical protein M1820_009467 [Bogoriella megaspora]